VILKYFFFPKIWRKYGRFGLKVLLVYAKKFIITHWFSRTPVFSATTWRKLQNLLIIILTPDIFFVCKSRPKLIRKIDSRREGEPDIRKFLGPNPKPLNTFMKWEHWEAFIAKGVSSRVARWFVFKPKIPIWVNFEGPLNGKCWYILWPFVIIYGSLV
jgi:hypothetical protein